jgi:DNA helicase-2/ATP-dependent DNA helicase PcrA
VFDPSGTERRSGGAGDRDLSGADGLLQGLTAAQRRAVESTAAPLCILAAAGAGKTRVLTRRIAYRCRVGSAAAGHTLALTFTRKAAGELRHRLAQLGLRDGVAAGTFHSHASAQLQRWWADRRQTPPNLLDRKSRILGPLTAERAGLSAVSLSELAAVIEWAKARTVSPDDFEAAVSQQAPERGRAPALPKGVSPAAVAALYGRYEAEKRRRGLLDFDDLLSRCADALERDQEFAGAQRWRWRHVYVDEFQDLNPLQHRLLLAWLGTSVDLCVVGDPNQAIYGWNGADPTLLDTFATRWPTAGILHLDVNHRCAEPIVRAAAAVLGPDGDRLSGVDRPGPLPEVVGFDSDQAEARGLAAGLLGAHREGRRWSAMAVLTRTNGQLPVIQQALTQAGIPWWSAASAAMLDEPAVREVLGRWRAEVRSGRTVALQTVRRDLEADAVEQAEAPAGPALAALAETAVALLTVRAEATVVDWLDWLPTTLKDRSDRTGPADAVTLSSFHRAKGLEWDLVWAAGIEEGLVPMGRSSSPAAEAEERRLLYVALTRAARELRVSWASTRMLGGRPVPRRPSRWLDAVATASEQAVAVGAKSEGPEWRDRVAAGVAEQREALGRAATQAGRAGDRIAGLAARRPAGRRTPADWPETDDRLRRLLLTWRSETARGTGVPPAVLLHDITLEALAALRPGTMDELLAVPGFGPVKACRYGPVLLDILSDRAQSA